MSGFGKSWFRAIGAIAVVFVVGFAVEGAHAQEREARTKVAWTGKIPELAYDEAGYLKPAAKPLMVYVYASSSNPHQKRFDEVAVGLDLVRLSAKFFTPIKVSEEAARAHPLMNDIAFRAPAVIVFDSTLTTNMVAGGKASGRKVFEAMRRIAVLDYVAPIDKVVAKAGLLLGNFDRVDAARAAMGIKQSRVDDARADGKESRARKLEREIEKKKQEMDALYDETDKAWKELFELERREREEPGR